MSRINSGYYTQLVQFMLKDGHVIKEYMRESKLNEWEVSNIFDEIRRLNEQYFKECDMISMDPRYNKDRATLLHGELKLICKKFKISINFNQNKTEAWKKKIFTQFYFKGNEITNLVSFFIKKKSVDLSLTKEDFEL